MGRFKCSVLFVDDEPALTQLAKGLLSADYDLRCADSAEEAQLLLARSDIDIVISDQQLPGLQGIPFLEWAREHSPRTVRILMTGIYCMDPHNSYACRPPGIYHGPFKSVQGCLLLEIHYYDE